MKNYVSRVRELTVRSSACLALGLLIGGCASEPRAVVATQTYKMPPLTDFCAAAQRELTSSRVPARNVVIADGQQFAQVQPSIKPFETVQYVEYADSQRLKPRMISCKLHSVERIRAEYGAAAAGEVASCARLNRRTLDNVMSGLTDRQRKKMPFKGTIPVMLDPDEQMASELDWMQGFTMVQVDAGGTLHIRARGLRGDTTGNLKVRNAGDARGKQYCHLIAPDYLRRILIGEVQLPRSEFPANGQTAAR
jgi:hypothetical protein